MASVEPDTQISFVPGAADGLVYGPPVGNGVVAVHPLALRASQNALTLVVTFGDGSPSWVGAIDESMVKVAPSQAAKAASVRLLIARQLSTGSSSLDIVRPGPLLRPGWTDVRTTVYKGDRPWIVIGRLQSGAVLAAPLNDASGRQFWFTPVVAPPDLDFFSAKASQVELAHLWSFPEQEVVGTLGGQGALAVQTTAMKYYT